MLSLGIFAEVFHPHYFKHIINHCEVICDVFESYNLGLATMILGEGCLVKKP